MEIDEFNKTKHEMESAIRQSVSKITNDFREKTGYSANHISINLLRREEIGMLRPHYLVESVKSDVNIE